MTDKNYKDILAVVKKHLEVEPEIFRNINRLCQTKSGQKMVVRNVYNIMLQLDFNVNSACNEYERRLSNDNN